jgi:uncharacterized membrane protein
MSDAPEPKTRKSGIWLRVVLFSSLAINLLIIGMVAGALLRGGPGPQGRPRADVPFFDLGNGPIGRALSGESRQQIGRGMAAREPDLRANREEIRAQYGELIRALRKDPFDPALVERIITAQQRKLLARQDIGKNLLVARVAQMTPEQRAEYATRLERFLRRTGGRN